MDNGNKFKLTQAVIFKFLYLSLRQVTARGLKGLSVDMNAIKNFPKNAEIKSEIEDGKLILYVDKPKRERRIFVPKRKIIGEL